MPFVNCTPVRSSGVVPMLRSSRYSGALLAPVWMHGVLNATGGTLVFVSGSDLLRGPAGLAGILVLAAMNLLLWLHRRRERTAPQRVSA